jgi:hypothetical protein
MAGDKVHDVVINEKNIDILDLYDGQKYLKS